MGYILGRSIVCVTSIASIIVAIRRCSKGLGFRKFTDLVHIVSSNLVIRVSLNFLIHIGDFLSAIENLFAHTAVSVWIHWNLKLVATCVAHRIQSLVASHWSF